ncbi:MAG: metallopeptidase TldD-related protein [Trichodesmium sp.]
MGTKNGSGIRGGSIESTSRRIVYQFRFRYKVENGERIGRVKNIMVVGNIFAAFKNIVDISKFSELVSGGYY